MFKKKETPKPEANKTEEAQDLHLKHLITYKQIRLKPNIIFEIGSFLQAIDYDVMPHELPALLRNNICQVLQLREESMKVALWNIDHIEFLQLEKKHWPYLQEVTLKVGPLITYANDSHLDLENIKENMLVRPRHGVIIKCSAHTTLMSPLLICTITDYDHILVVSQVNPQARLEEVHVSLDQITVDESTYFK